MPKKPLRTIFFGTPDFALSSLRACYKNSTLLGVVTQPDRPRGRGHKLSPCPVRALAQEWGIPTFAPESLKRDSVEKDELFSFLDRQMADLFVVTAYGNILPESFLNSPPLGSINVHASLLPKWRGAAPIQRCLEMNDSETGVCIQQMVYALDAGDVISELRTAIDPNENALELAARLSDLGGKLLGDLLEKADLSGATTQDSKLVTLAAKITKDEGHWQPTWSTQKTHNRVRAFAAWPQVKARVAPLGLDIKILKTRVFAQAKPASSPKNPGILHIEAGQVYLETGVRAGELLTSSRLELLQVQAAGKGPVAAYEFFKNLSIPSGDPLRLEGL